MLSNKPGQPAMLTCSKHYRYAVVDADLVITIHHEWITKKFCVFCMMKLLIIDNYGIWICCSMSMKSAVSMDIIFFGLFVINDFCWHCCGYRERLPVGIYNCVWYFSAW